MGYTILLDLNADRRLVENEEKSKFLRSVLEAMGVDIADLWPEGEELTPESKILLRRRFNDLQLIILDNVDGTLEVWFESKPIAIMEKPKYVLRRDRTQKDPKKQLFLEMHVNFSSSLLDG